MRLKRVVKLMMRWESILPALLLLSAGAYAATKDGDWKWDIFFDIVTCVVAVTVPVMSFASARATNKERQQFEKDLATEMNSRHREILADLNEDRKQWQTKRDETRRINRREDQALEAFQKDIDRIEGRLPSMARRAAGLPDEAHFVIHLPKELDDIVDFITGDRKGDSN